MTGPDLSIRLGKPSRRRSLRKQWLFCGLTLLMSVGALEFSSVLLWMLYPPTSLVDLSAIQEHVARMGTDRKSDLEALHPYLGWVFNPDSTELAENPRDELTVNSLGFVDTGSSIQRRSPDRFVIGVFGGSVAQQMATIGEQAFRDKLSESPSLIGREIQIVRLAMSGYKQPQQLMALNYVLALGGEFDIVVNIDGYNETGLVVGENDRQQVFAAYPRAWQVRLQDVVDPRNSAISYQLLLIRATRQARAQWIVGSILRRSWTVSLVWAAQDSILQLRQTNLGQELLDRFKKQGRGFARQGPRQMYSNREEMYEHITDLWTNSSLQMHHLCSGRGIRYLHFLQPNQYHAGSKTLSPYELKKCYAPDERAAIAVKDVYPRLIEAGGRLQQSGVLFHDVTQLFAAETDTIYNDYFCHYNSRGTELLAEMVATRIVESLTQE